MDGINFQPLLSLSPAGSLTELASANAGSTVSSVAFSGDGTKVVSGDDNGVKVWDAGVACTRPPQLSSLPLSANPFTSRAGKNHASRHSGYSITLTSSLLLVGNTSCMPVPQYDIQFCQARRRHVVRCLLCSSTALHNLLCNPPQ